LVNTLCHVHAWGASQSSPAFAFTAPR
jgi:hypothetical protein